MSNINKLLDVMARLRDPDCGCPWDRRQNFASIAPYTIEEAYEVADAIAGDDFDALRGELGDLLFQVVFHARMAEEAGHFDFDAVAGAIVDKMIRRHPHVFGGDSALGIDDVNASWERIKADERRQDGDGSVLAGIATALPALARADKLGRRAARVGFDWPDRRGVRAKIREELDEVGEAGGSRDPSRVREEIGDLLFAVVNLARHYDVDAEEALRGANRKFERRFRAMEAEFAGRNVAMADLSLETLEQAWRAAKRAVD